MHLKPETWNLKPALPPQAARRRGVLILVVLSLLFLFVLIAITYVLVATRQLTASKQFARASLTGDPPAAQLNKALMQVLRGDAPTVDANNLEHFHSVIGPHSLLESMYGPYTISGTVNNVNPNGAMPGGEIVEFDATNPQTVLPSFQPYLPAAQLANVLQIDGYLEGCVITMTSGAAKGLSSRIVRYDYPGVGTPLFHVLAFRKDGVAILPANGDTFVVNGRAFSGTGFGYYDNTGEGDARDWTGGTLTRREFALLPNPVTYIDGVTTTSNDYFTAPNYHPFGGEGGANDDYTSPDYKHMALAFITDDPTPAPRTFPSLPRLPSFHRPDLINYWFQRMVAEEGAGWSDWTSPITTDGDAVPDGQQLLRKVMLRPNPIDHPNFSGSNPYLAATASFQRFGGGTNLTWQDFILGVDPTTLAAPMVIDDGAGNPLSVSPWDVDNDGDGVPDSVWLDLGFPVQTAPDGRLYKPLFAILCVDLDGRLNVNAHGTSQQLAAAGGGATQSEEGRKFYGQTFTTPPAAAPAGTLSASDLTPNAAPLAGTTSYAAGAPTPVVILPRGLGVGPAEINLVSAFFQQTGNLANAIADVRTLLDGNGATYEGRYGASLYAGPTVTTPYPSPLAEAKRYEYPRNNLDPYNPTPVVAPPTTPMSAYNSPADLWGRMALALDYTGAPYYWKPFGAGGYQDWTDETLRSPYDIDLSLNATRIGKAWNSGTADNPYTVNDLERALRPWDADSAMLSHRLTQLVGIESLMVPPNYPNDAVRRARILTTDSWDPPSPGVIAPRQMRDSNNAPEDILSSVGLFARRYSHNLVELMMAKLMAAPPSGGGMLQPAASAEVRRMLAPELIAGLRMNINRRLGDGRDSDGNGVVDEPTPAEAAAEGNPTASDPNWLWAQAFTPTVQFDLVNGQDVDQDGANQVNAADQVMARQLMARHLYVLARLLIDDDALANVNWFATEIPPLSLAETRELAIRRIAQWAINVVDSITPDNSMTPFEYDVNPWDGWLPMDGDPSTNEGGQRRLVWGCKGQPLLITETLAFHDRRVADTMHDPSGKDRGTPSMPEDQTLDQVRIPEGSLFVELYATHSPWNPQFSQDLYTYDTATSAWYLDLAKLAPAGNDGVNASAQYPVWRLAISQPNNNVGQGGPSTLSPRNFLTTQSNSASLEPKQYVGDTNNYGSLINGSTLNDVDIERIVWFTGNSGTIMPPTDRLSAVPDGTNHIDGNNTYYLRAAYNQDVPGSAFVAAGGYAVIGPRAITYIGSQTAAGGGQPWGQHSLQHISIDFTTATAGVTRPNGTPDYPTIGTHIRRPVGLVCAANQPATWSTAPNGIGLNISEPLPQGGPASNPYTYYNPEPTTANAPSGKSDAYGDLSAGGNPTTFPDTPFERSTNNNALTARPVENLPSTTHTNTTFNYRTIYLQRLANPSLPYHRTGNPYLTVDWMPVDLTVFNGEDNVDQHPSWNGSEGTWDPDDPNPSATALPTFAFASRQRGMYSQHANILTDNNPANPAAKFRALNVFSVHPDADPALTINNLGGEDPASLITIDAADPSLTNLNFRHKLRSAAGLAGTGQQQNRSTLGYVNYGYGDPWSTSDNPAAPAAYVGTPSLLDTVSGLHVPKPFPWLAWNNRPYTNVAELATVPATHPARLTLEFATHPNAQFDAYSDDSKTVGGIPQQRIHYPYLLNMLRSPLPTAVVATGLETVPSQILEYLQTPSPYVGTETILNPSNFTWAWGTVGEPPVGNEPVGTAGLHPPFNTVSNYRDPGKVNINTITSDAVWQAILGADPSLGAAPNAAAPGPHFIEAGAPNSTISINTSRRGYVAAGTDHYAFDNNHPSIFSNPFRSAAGADMVPLTGGAGGTDLRRRPVNATLWRASGPTPDTDSVPLLASNITPYATDYNDWHRNAYFGYQEMGTFMNKLTTRSNVYAVWITVGYFEVTPWYGRATTAPFAPNPTGTTTFDPAHPDGYQLGQELGADTGGINRHRAFYIIDRTIPVGFQRGVDLNSDKAVLLKRFIE